LVVPESGVEPVLLSGWPPSPQLVPVPSPSLSELQARNDVVAVRVAASNAMKRVLIEHLPVQWQGSLISV
jgi:hypothetical protein